jgi:dTDP-glucose 4,6-dehydratase
MLSLFTGMMERSYALVTDIPEAEIWVMDPAVQYADEPIGITQFAVESLGDITQVDLPKEGEAITKEAVFGTVESVKAVSDVYAPLSGEVTEVNATLAENPEKINQDPYGDGWMVKVKLSDPSEVDVLMDAVAYNASKAGADHAVRAYHETFGVPVTITNCSNNYGPYQFPEKVIPLFVTNLLEGKPMPLYGDGLNVRDWLYVDDHCAGVHLVLTAGAPGEIYNIGAGNETPNRVIVDALLRQFGVGEEMVEYVEDRAGHDRRYSVDISKISELGWQKQRTLDEALDQTVSWYRANAWWWEPLKQSNTPDQNQ